MKKILAFLLVIAAATSGYAADGRRLVLMHTNDTHSQIDPDSKNLGGVIRRKVLIDSIRAVEPYSLLIDAGDAVQGTLFFNLFKGEVESKLLNMLGYDIAILGNHEFDNGMDALSQYVSNANNVTWLTTNYDLRGTSLQHYFAPYKVMEIDGRKIAFIAVNLEPRGMISEGNYDGVKYMDAMKAANSTAWHLKHNEGIDFVVAITHIGYDGQPGPRDESLAQTSEDIDVIIGGHSHTSLSPLGLLPTVFKNAAGKDVIVAQTGSRGANLGVVEIDLNTFATTSKLIPVDSRLDGRERDEAITMMLAPYRSRIDSIMSIPVAKSAVELDKERELNLFADMVLTRGRQLADGVQLSIINKGGIRRTLPKGTITAGEVMTTLPFNNRVVVIDITGEQLLDALNVMAGRDGDGVGGNIVVSTEGDPAHVSEVIIDGKSISPAATYRVATIDYLANGGDYMASLVGAPVIAKSDNILYEDVIALMKAQGKKKLNPSAAPRM